MLFEISVYRFLPLWRISICSIALQCFLGSAYIDFCRSRGSVYIDFYRSGTFSRHTAQHSPVVLLSMLIQQRTSNICSISLQCFLGSAYINFYRSGIFSGHTAQHSPVLSPFNLSRLLNVSNICSCSSFLHTHIDLLFFSILFFYSFLSTFHLLQPVLSLP